MRKFFITLLFPFLFNSLNAETLGTFGLQMGDDIYEGYQIGIIQPLTELNIAASATMLDDGTLLTVGAQKGMELFPSTMLYGFADVNRFFWDSSVSNRVKTQLAWGFGVSVAILEPIFIDLKYKKFESYSEPYTYVGISYMF